ncbi:MAG: AmmeMemoRadiSam system protein B [bacterium]
MLVFSALTPHPPIMIPNVGGDNLKQIKNTVDAMEKLGDMLAEKNPDSLIIISPHGGLLPQAFTINLSPALKANFKNFGDFVTEMNFPNDTVLGQTIKEETTLPTLYSNNEELDHGASAPLFYLTQKTKNLPIVPLGYSFLSYEEHFKFGFELQQIINKTDKRIAVIASGDLSHRLTAEAPAGFSPQGNIFDEKLINLIKEKDAQEILNLDKNLIEEAGECGMRSLIILLGVLSRTEYQPEILSYEGPFGVGYLVANFGV